MQYSVVLLSDKSMHIWEGATSALDNVLYSGSKEQCNAWLEHAIGCYGEILATAEEICLGQAPRIVANFFKGNSIFSLDETIEITNKAFLFVKNWFKCGARVSVKTSNEIGYISKEMDNDSFVEVLWYMQKVPKRHHISTLIIHTEDENLDVM